MIADPTLGSGGFGPGSGWYPSVIGRGIGRGGGAGRLFGLGDICILRRRYDEFYMANDLARNPDALPCWTGSPLAAIEIIQFFDEDVPVLGVGAS